MVYIDILHLPIYSCVRLSFIFIFYLLLLNSNKMSLYKIRPDIWKDILDQLGKTDLRQAGAVCKTWNKISNSLFNDCNISVSLCSYQYKKFLDDLNEYPLFAFKVNELVMFSEAGDDDNINTLRAILKHCPNLLRLRFTEKHIYGYLKMLTTRNKSLSRIQEIDVLHLQTSSAAIKRIYIWVCHNHRETIKSLQFMGVQENSVLKHFGGLITFTQLFPELAHIKVRGDWAQDDTVCVDINELLMKNTKLESIIMGNIARITGQLTDLPLLSEDLTYPSLTKLHLYRFETDIHILEYIRSRFTNLEELFFVDVNVTPSKDVSNTTAGMMIENFNMMPINKLCLSYNYRDSCYNTFMNIPYLPQWSGNVGYADRYIEKVYTYDLSEEV